MIKQFINGQYIEGKGAKMDLVNPSTGKVIESFMGANAEQAHQALLVAQKTFKTYRKTPLDDRVASLTQFANLIEEHLEEIAKINSEESGKVYAESVGDIQFGIQVIRFQQEEVRRIYGVSLPDYPDSVGKAYHIIEKRPIGVVVGHLAWNYPIYNACLKIGPAVASGCTLVIKPSSKTPRATLLLGKLLNEAGVPSGVVNIITGPADELGTALNTSTIPKMITVIGSTRTGKRVMKEGSSSIKKYSFELGGNAPCFVLNDADLDIVADNTCSFKMGNSGQSCIAQNRMFVEKDVYDTFVSLVARKISSYHCGVWKDEGNTFGPLISKAAQKRMGELVEDAVAKGAKLLYGGHVPSQRPQGNWFEPTLLVDCNKSMKVFQEEIFGPIIAISQFSDLDVALEEASNTDAGLSSYVYGHDSRRLAKIYEALEFGEVNVNALGIGSVVHLPHVGIKQSGVGCDNSLWSLEEYYDLKRIHLVPDLTL